MITIEDFMSSLRDEKLYCVDLPKHYIEFAKLKG